MTRYTIAAEVARLAGISRERVRQLLAAGRFPHAAYQVVGTHGTWRIPVRDVGRFLRARGQAVPRWVKRTPSWGHWPDTAGDVWVGLDS